MDLYEIIIYHYFHKSFVTVGPVGDSRQIVFSGKKSVQECGRRSGKFKFEFVVAQIGLESAENRFLTVC